MIGIIVGIAIMEISVGVVNGFQNEIPAKITGFWGQIQIETQRLSESSSTLPLDFSLKNKNDLKKIKSIEWFSPIIYKAGIAKTTHSFEGVIIKGIDTEYSLSYLKSHLISGNGSKIDLTGSNCLIPSTIADKLNLKVSDSLTIYFIQNPLRIRRLIISGIYKTPIQNELGKSFVITNLTTLQRLNNWSDSTYSAIEVHLKNGAEIVNSSDQINEVLPLNLTSNTIYDQFTQLYTWLSLFDTNKIVLLIIMLSVSTLNLITALLVLIMERTNQVGILKTLGFSNYHLRQYFLLLSTKILVPGFVIGNLLGLGLIVFQRYFGVFSLPEDTYYLNQIPVLISLKEVLYINLATLFTCILTLLIPVLIISKISPVKTIKFD